MPTTLFTPNSSTIQQVAYHGKHRTLEVEFREGGKVRYRDVPRRLWEVFQLHTECDGSAGAFFNRYILHRFAFEESSPSASAGRN